MPHKASEAPETYRIHGIATGGTIDSRWDASKDTAKTRDASIVPEYTERVRLPRHSLSYETVCLEDSRDIGFKLQNLIAARIAQSVRKKIMVTAGSYLTPDFARETMEQEGAKHFERIGKMIAFVVSGKPIDGFLLSDGGFNLGMGAASLQDLKNVLSVIIMNGLCLDALKVRKDLTTATYSSIGRGKDLLPYDSFTLIPLGGNIDFVEDGLGGLEPGSESIIPSYLREHVQMQRYFEAVSPFIQNGKELSDDDMGIVLDIIRESTAERILVTLDIHSMRRLQNFLRENLKAEDNDRKVVLTGSRYSLSLGDMTDAPFNLGYALGKIASVREGVHIALNGFIPRDCDNIAEIIYTKREQEVLRSRGVIQ